MRFVRVLSCITCFAIGVCSVAQPPVIAPTENLVVYGIPAIPAEIAETVRRYTESRSAGFVEWHPVNREMLISTRFGNTPQLHLVKMPGGDRRQMTFFSEPVSNASWEPTTGGYFVFGKDVGGNEFGQLYRHDIATGAVTLMTDGGRSQNGGVLWNRGKDKFLYSTTRRNGADRDLWIMNPLNPQDSKPIAELSGEAGRVSTGLRMIRSSLPLSQSPSTRPISGCSTLRLAQRRQSLT